ncbi:GAF domain-containing protein [Paenibacillus xanthanilyticus]|uniref:GAF domain-containing protein n=1 Tax=Paenibacillus xanthanilyticus TaxID=1783531 RepID=A0ABV8K893_9BACL
MNGSNIREHLALELERLRERNGSDFAAIALPASDDRAMRWQIVLGGRNGKVGQMKIKPGVGLGGMVLRHGTVYTVNDGENAELLEACPVMLAERLASGIACPLIESDTGPAAGILLFGRRGREAYEKFAISRIGEEFRDSGLLTGLLDGDFG